MALRVGLPEERGNCHFRLPHLSSFSLLSTRYARLGEMHQFFTGLVYCVQELAFVGSVPRDRCGFSHLSIWISSASLHQTAEVHVPNDTEPDLAPTTPKMSSIWTAGLFFSPKQPVLLECLQAGGKNHEFCNSGRLRKAGTIKGILPEMQELLGHFGTLGSHLVIGVHSLFCREVIRLSYELLGHQQLLGGCFSLLFTYK